MGKFRKKVYSHNARKSDAIKLKLLKVLLTKGLSFREKLPGCKYKGNLTILSKAE